ncbi:MAG: Type IIS restriction enzyme Eco57I [Microgenomates group bacterium ADurb.Bin238]|nr:MAG: Type IIS restriction enzyme Eco57I [Microgenomates group bacterium ADurb.Bin238]
MNLSEKFNQQEFINWIEKFLPNFSNDHRKVDIPNGLTGVTSISTLGESALGVRVFIIETEKDPSGRKIGLAKESFNLIKNYGTPNALIAYYSKESSKWRLSLLTSTPEWSDGKIITKLSNPKRQSYVLGEDAKVNTPTRFLLKKDAVTDITDLKSRFSLEVVNKEFYKEISESFIKLVGGTTGTGRNQKKYESLLKLPSVTDHSQTSIEFAVRLIGRIIFCWFLREKKGPDGTSLMPKELLSLEAIEKNPDYYHKVLEPIFFEVLNQPAKSRKDLFYGKPYSLIPYLNGGLFSPHKPDDFYERKNGDLQSRFHNTLIIPDSWFVELFKTLETYNFTIDENTSFDEELSIDPEMLGRIFENLLAEINPETGESARKSTGSYYTPRVIVDYMVDESLLLYLKQQTGVEENKLRAIISYDLTDDNQYPLDDSEKQKVIDALEKIKILDPACGSGAFPIGALQKMVFILQQADPEGHLWFKKQIRSTSPEIQRVLEREFTHKNFDYIRKLGVIRENIYGVDIQPIATEISRLRCFLTLVVDERIDDSLENRGIEPLPNLDFKFVTANSLIGLPKRNQIDKKVGGRASLFEDDKGIEELKEVRDMFFNASGSERELLKLEFMQIQKQMLQHLIGFGSAPTELTSKLTTWDPFSHKASDWFDPEWMFGMKDGFDIVIANPPYVQFQKLEIDFREVLRKHNQYESQSDLWYFFVYKGFELLKKQGVLSFIVSHYFLQAGHGGTLREFVTKNFKIESITNFSDQHVFESVGVHNSILLLTKTETSSYKFLYQECDDVRLLGSGVLSGHMVNKSSLGKTWLLVNEEENYLVNKLFSKGVRLGTISQISNGVKSGDDQVFILEIDKGNLLVEQELLKDYLKNSDIHKYYVDKPTKQIIYAHSNIDTGKYPLFRKYINTYRDLLERKWKNRGEESSFWMLYRPRENIYLSGKRLIIVPYRTKNIGFSLNNNCLSGTDTYVILNNSQKIEDLVLLAILNSRLTSWLYEKIGKRKGGIFEIATEELSKLPIQDNIKLAKQKEIITHVEKILNLTGGNDYRDNAEKQEQVKIHENQIDQMVYELYELTPEEIAIVEGK